MPFQVEVIAFPHETHPSGHLIISLIAYLELFNSANLSLSVLKDLGTLLSLVRLALLYLFRILSEVAGKRLRLSLLCASLRRKPGIPGEWN